MSANRSQRRPEPPPSGVPSVPDLVRAGPTAVRLAAQTWWRTGRWTLDTSYRVTARVGRAVIAGENPGDLLNEAGDEAREYLRRALGIVDIVAASATNVATPDAPRPSAEERAAQDDPTVDLRRRGAELLRRSADVEYQEDAHPAFDRIVGSLAPDEARILRFLCSEGPQPSVDVRGASGVKLQYELVAPGLNMLGTEAGVRYLRRVPSYLNNLERLGLIWFSREQLTDPREYQVLEAQPEVQEALDGSTRSKTVRRSIHLTPFGQDFCTVVLPEEVETEGVRERDREGGRAVRETNGGPDHDDGAEERYHEHQEEDADEHLPERARGEEPT